jgi:hypothetical protein
MEDFPHTYEVQHFELRATCAHPSSYRCWPPQAAPTPPEPSNNEQPTTAVKPTKQVSHTPTLGFSAR